MERVIDLARADEIVSSEGFEVYAENLPKLRALGMEPTDRDGVWRVFGGTKYIEALNALKKTDLVGGMAGALYCNIDMTMQLTETFLTDVKHIAYLKKDHNTLLSAVMDIVYFTRAVQAGGVGGSLRLKVKFPYKINAQEYNDYYNSLNLMLAENPCIRLYACIPLTVTVSESDKDASACILPIVGTPDRISGFIQILNGFVKKAAYLTLHPETVRRLQEGPDDSDYSVIGDFINEIKIRRASAWRDEDLLGIVQAVNATIFLLNCGVEFSLVLIAKTD